MRLPGWKTARGAAHWLHSRIDNFVLILGYHRVAETAVDPYDLCVRPDHFAGQLEILRRRVRVIDIHTLAIGLQTGDLPRRAVVITFDDGYLDNLQTAQPLLAAHDLPATVFVVSGALGQEFWWDRLTRIIFDPAILPDSLSVEIGGKLFSWPMLADEYLPQQKTMPSPRHRLLQQLYQRMKKVPAERPMILRQLEEWAEMAVPLPHLSARAMTTAELQSLNNHGRITIGSHTVTHPVLTNLPEEQQCMELCHSRHTLEKILDQPVVAFSYPHGANDVVTQRLVQKAGFQLACSSQNGIVHKWQDPFALPRFWVPDWDGEQFGRWLARWVPD